MGEKETATGDEIARRRGTPEDNPPRPTAFNDADEPQSAGVAEEKLKSGVKVEVDAPGRVAGPGSATERQTQGHTFGD